MEKDLKVWAFTMASVLISIAVYNSLIKRYTPTAVRNIIGLG